MNRDVRIFDADFMIAAMTEVSEGWFKFDRAGVWDDPPLAVYQLRPSDPDGYQPTFVYCDLDTGEWYAEIEACWRKSRPYRSKRYSNPAEAMLEVFEMVNDSLTAMGDHIDMGPTTTKEDK